MPTFNCKQRYRNKTFMLCFLGPHHNNYDGVASRVTSCRSVRLPAFRPSHLKMCKGYHLEITLGSIGDHLGLPLLGLHSDYTFKMMLCGGMGAFFHDIHLSCIIRISIISGIRSTLFLQACVFRGNLNESLLFMGDLDQRFVFRDLTVNLSLKIEYASTCHTVGYQALHSDFFFAVT